jgi:short-subunit dehydrogenase
MKILIITGGSKGLGKEIVSLYLKDNWKVFDLSRTGTTKDHREVDLSDIDSIPNIIEEIINELLNIEIEEFMFINNAATLTPISKTRRLSDVDIIKNVNVNIVSALIMIKHIIARFRDLNCNKTLINISSGAANKGHSGWSLYCTSKAGMENFFNTLFEEEQSETYPFSIINFDPYIMDTSMQEEIRSTSRVDFPGVDRFISYKQDCKLMKPITVAKILKSLLTTKNFKQCRYEAVKLRDGKKSS